MKQLWQVTLRTQDGGSIGTYLMETEPIGLEEHPSGSTPQSTRPKLPAGSSDGEPKMTEPQRRYLFRLLALQGVEGTAAEEHLKEYFKVKALKDIPKAAASQLIDQMIRDVKEAGDGGA
ncbi:MAG: hypothetical protein ACE5JQ_00750 [Candidatus Methylomirabilales bacterium]